MINLFLFLTGNIFSDTVYYIICGILSLFVLFGIFLMSKVEKSVLGNKISALAIGIAIVITLIKYDIVPIWLLYPAIIIGGVIGVSLALRVKMIEMPELVALLNGVGGAASAIVGIFAAIGIGGSDDIFSKSTAFIAIAIGVTTLFGSLIAAGKLHKVISQKPIVLPKHTLFTTSLLLLLIISIILGSFPGLINPIVIIIITIIVALSFGLIFTIRVGGADMPITISLLNSFSGVAAAIAGLAISDLLLVAVGGIVGASGLLLTQIMCRAMNRNLLEILLGKTTTVKKETKSIEEKIEPKKPITKTNYLDKIKKAKKVIIVPGYGMAIAQAQHLVKQLADKLKANGASVKYAIHPVAGRMPGHMNVLLCEADVDYEDLYEMDDINEEFKDADLAIVVGANDVLNPAAREAEGTPIYGMPILNVDQCKNIIIFNYDLSPGYSGVENPLYNREAGVTLILGNAFETVKKFIDEM